MSEIINENGAEVLYYPGWIDEEKARELFALCDSYEKVKYPIKIFGKEVLQPRTQIAFSDKISEHHYSGASIPQQQWPEQIREIRDRILREFEFPADSCLVNGYKDGSSYIGYHSDSELQDLNQTVITVSLGGSRRFLLKKKSDGEVRELLLRNGDCVVMRGNTQKYWKHSLPKTAKKCEPRFSLTFRQLFE